MVVSFYFEVGAINIYVKIYPNSNLITGKPSLFPCVVSERVSHTYINLEWDKVEKLSWKNQDSLFPTWLLKHKSPKSTKQRENSDEN